MTELKVVTMREHSLRDISAQMRQLADRIDAGEFGAVVQAGAVLMGDTCEAFAWGDGINGSDPAASGALLFQAAAHRVIAEIANHGRQDDG